MMIIKNYRKFATVALAVVTLVSCKPDLEVVPRDQISDLTVWGNSTNADLFLNDIYNNLPEINTETQLLDQYTDNQYVGAEWMWGRTTIATATINPNNIPPGPGENGGMWVWNTTYARIRKCNLFIQKVTESNDLDDEYKASRIAEARFLRAFFYHYLWLAYGGVPVITDVLDNNDPNQDIYRARNTDEETFSFIATELTDVAEALPTTRSVGDAGRPTKGAALTLRGFIELYWASPLRNPNDEMARWQTAAATNKEVIDLGIYELFSDYEKLFYRENSLARNSNNKESIFVRLYVSLIKGHQREGRQGPAYVNGIQQSWGNLTPTQELVDDYAMDNGLMIDEAGSGYDPQKPYEGREPRFYQSIIYDGATWQGDEIFTRRGVGAQNEIDLGSGSDVSNTGYYGRKTLDERITGQTSISQVVGESDYIFFRFAEVLLNFAEAQNEVNGPDALVLDAVNKIRIRGGLPTIEDTYGSVTKDQMRDIIWRERRIELAFEDKRWWDILRWKIADGPEGVLNKPLHGIVIEDADNDGILTYTPAKVVDRLWDSRMYLLPIPQGAIDTNPKLQGHQNPGY
jgi:starch-binding outer membrane protein, SusD/RagB family